MNVVQKFLTNNDCYKTGRTIIPKGIMVHSTGTSQSKASVYIRNWNKPNINKCVHAFIDNTGIYQTLPWNHRGWHSGAAANSTHIGFEICEPDGFTYEGNQMIGYDPKANQVYFDTVWSSAIQLSVFLCTEFNLNPLVDIIDHSEGHRKGIATNHMDVAHWFSKHGKNMDMFREEVNDIILNNGLDNKPDPYAFQDIRWAIDNKVLRGDNRGNLRLHDSVTRQDCLVFIKRTIDTLK